MRVVFEEPPLIVFFERADREADLALWKSQRPQYVLREIERRQKRFPLDMLHSKVHQPMNVTAVACAGVDWNAGKMGPYELSRLQRGFNVVDGENESPRLVHFGGFQNRKPARVAEIALIA